MAIRRGGPSGKKRELAKERDQWKEKWESLDPKRRMIEKDYRLILQILTHAREQALLEDEQRMRRRQQNQESPNPHPSPRGLIIEAHPLNHLLSPITIKGEGVYFFTLNVHRSEKRMR